MIHIYLADDAYMRAISRSNKDYMQNFIMFG